MSLLRFFRPLLSSTTSDQNNDAISEADWAAAEAQLPFLAFLSGADRLRLRELAQRFLHEKEFHGANGLELTPAILLGIALQACLPILNLGLAAYRGWVGIVVYPGEILIPRQQQDEAGVVHVFQDSVLGEAWEGGPVLLSWSPADEPFVSPNVVIHEFAHKLDMANGEADGCPPLPPDMSQQEWCQVFSEAYECFCTAVDAGEETLIDPYAAEHPAEFFAVVSEVFFETPGLLKHQFGEVYEQLRRFYRQDPAAGELSADARLACCSNMAWKC